MSLLIYHSLFVSTQQHRVLITCIIITDGKIIASIIFDFLTI